MITLLITLTLSAVTLVPSQPAAAKGNEPPQIYFNEACADCAEYLYDELIPFLKTQGMDNPIIKDYINNRAYRKELNLRTTNVPIPFTLQSHLMTFIDDGDLIFAGHVPEKLMKETMAERSSLPRPFIIFQDNMPDMGQPITQYTVWTPTIDPVIKTIDTPLSQFIQEYESKTLQPASSSIKKQAMLPLILSSGLIDGVNPCAFAVLIFFIAFLFSLKSDLKRIFLYGMIYIGVIYLTYLGIGLGLFKAILISSAPHFMARVGSWLVIVLGLIQLLSIFAPKFPIKLQIPRFSQGTLKHWLTKATLPGVIVSAFLVGLCTFPCSGGIYVAIVSLLAAKNTFLQGFGYLLIYNVMFVVPLIVLLVLAANKYTLGKVGTWHAKNDTIIKITLGGVMIALGIIILLWFV